MAHKLSQKGKEIYNTLHGDLQLIIDWTLKHVAIDITLTEGHRPVEKQFEYYKKGREQDAQGDWKIVNKAKVITYIDGHKKKGNHNYKPSRAFDFCVYVSGKGHLSWNKTHISYVAGAMVSKAEELYEKGKISHKLRWGYNWDRDGDLSDNTFVDMPHIELYKP